MKKITLLLSFLFITFNTFSQNYKKRTPEEKARYYTSQLQKDIDIDSIQFEKIYEINLSVSLKFDSLYAEKMEDFDRRRAMVPIFKYRDAEYRKVLTPTQFLKFDDMQREAREKKKKAKEQQTNSPN